MAVRCIIKEKNKLLLCHVKKDNFYFLPGGSVQFQEELQDAIYRELKEEMAIDKEHIKIKSFLAICETIFEEEHSIDPIFEIELSKDTNIKSNENHINFQWIEINKINEIDFRPNTLKNWILNDYKQNHIIHNLKKNNQ